MVNWEQERTFYFTYSGLIHVSVNEKILHRPQFILWLAASTTMQAPSICMIFCFPEIKAQLATEVVSLKSDHASTTKKNKNCSRVCLGLN